MNQDSIDTLHPGAPPQLLHWTPSRIRQLRKSSALTDQHRRTMSRLLTTLRRQGIRDGKAGLEDRQHLVDVLAPIVGFADRTATATYIEVGLTLAQVRAAIPHGAWLSLFPGHRRGTIRSPFTMSAQKVQALMRIVEHAVLSDPANWAHLPLDNWRTLDEMTRVPAGELQGLINRGVIHRDVMRREVLALRGATIIRSAPADLQRVDGPRLDAPLTPAGIKELLGQFVQRLCREYDVGLRDTVGPLRALADQLEVTEAEADDQADGEDNDRISRGGR